MRKRHTTRYPGIRYRLLDESRPDGPRRYIIGYTDANGSYHTETLGLGYTLDDARARKATLEGVKRTHVPVTKTVSLLLDEYLAARHDLKPKTREDYEWATSHLKDKLGQRAVRDLTPTDIANAIAAWKQAGMKAWSIKKILTPLVGALRVAMREGWITSNPAERLLPHERPRSDQKDMRVLSTDEIEALLRAASSDRWRVLFALLAFTGLRIGEALALRWEDVFLLDGYLKVRSSKTAAGVRDVMVIKRLAFMLRKHRLSQAPGTQFIFANAKGEPVSRREALRALRAAEKRANIPNYTLHELRHTFASILIAQRETPALVADQMGHANPAVTMTTYAKLFDAQKNVDAARERLQRAMGGN